MASILTTLKMQIDYLPIDELRQIKMIAEQELMERGDWDDAPLIRIDSLGDYLKAEVFADAMQKHSIEELQKRLA